MLINEHANTIPAFFYQIDYTLYEDMSDDTELFHAQWRREAITQLGKDYTIVDGIRGIGRYVGTYIGLSTLQRYWWGEGEIKFYIDGDREFPTICGTGMEDYFGGSWSFSQKGDLEMKEHCYSMHYLDIRFIPGMIHWLPTRIIMMIVRRCVDFTGGTQRIPSFLMKI